MLEEGRPTIILRGLPHSAIEESAEQDMLVHFCHECGALTLGPATHCGECRAELEEDSWAEVSEEELRQLEYIDEFDLPPGLPAWEYDVIKLKPEADAGGLAYNTEVLNRMGEKGWELVSVVSSGRDDGSCYGVFKRSYLAEEEE